MVIDWTQSKNESERMLLTHILKGDELAMRALYCRYVKYLAAICSRYINNDEDVKDVLQDIFLKIFSSIGVFEYKGSGSLKAWMAKIALNESLKFIKRNNKLVFTELKYEEMESPEDDTDTTDVSSSVIYEMIRNLPVGYRTIFNLYVIEEKSHKEIAKLLNIKESTSASQLYRAKAILANKINKYRKINSVSV